MEKNLIFINNNSLKFLIFLFIFILISIENIILKQIKYIKKNHIKSTNYRLLLKKINQTFEQNEYVNINEIESILPNGRKWEKLKNRNNEINIGFQLDPNYIFRAMMTLASIMDSQKYETKIRFHFAVVLSFNAEHMLKIYSLRDKIRDDVEFNFYNAKKVEIDLKNLNSKGPGAVAKLLLPEIIPNNINKLIIFDTGDLLVLRDLSEIYNWNMSNFLYLGQPGIKIGDYATISKKKFITYINTGSMLINVEMVKKEKLYEKFVKNKDAYNGPFGDQTLQNDIAFGKIGYLPIKF